MDVTAMGKVGLSGWRGAIGSKVAEPIAARSALSQDQVEAIMGGIFLLLSAWEFAKLVRRVLAAGRGELDDA